MSELWALAEVWCRSPMFWVFVDSMNSVFQVFGIAPKHRSTTTEVLCLPPARVGTWRHRWTEATHSWGFDYVLQDRVERFLGPMGPRMYSWGISHAAKRWITQAGLLGQVLPRRAKPNPVTRLTPWRKTHILQHSNTTEYHSMPHTESRFQKRSRKKNSLP